MPDIVSYTPLVAKSLFQLKAAAKDCNAVCPSIQELIDECNLACCIKSMEGVILMINPTYQRTFCPNSFPIGSRTDAFLEQELGRICKALDTFVTGGCELAEAIHEGYLHDGSYVIAQTAKTAVCGLRSRTSAIIGLTSILRLSSKTSVGIPRPNLQHQLRSFNELPSAERTCAILYARGDRRHEIAAKLDVSVKTVDKYRLAALEKLRLQSTMQLGQALCRIQDAGLADFEI